MSANCSDGIYGFFFFYSFGDVIIFFILNENFSFWFLIIFLCFFPIVE